jgi:hypothetical protein
MYTDSDILDGPEKPKINPDRTFRLLYIELSLIGSFGIIAFFELSSIITSIFVIYLLTYACIAPFFKPQFTKGKFLRITLGIWNIIHVLLFGLMVLFIAQSWPSVFHLSIASFSSLAIYCLILPFVESHKIKSIRFLSIFFFGLGFSILCIALLYQINNERHSRFLLAVGSIFVGIAALMMLFQLVKDTKTPIHYLFYLPRVIGLLIMWLILFYLS